MVLNKQDNGNLHFVKDDKTIIKMSAVGFMERLVSGRLYSEDDVEQVVDYMTMLERENANLLSDISNGIDRNNAHETNIVNLQNELENSMDISKSNVYHMEDLDNIISNLKTTIKDEESNAASIIKEKDSVIAKLKAELSNCKRLHKDNEKKKVVKKPKVAKKSSKSSGKGKLTCEEVHKIRDMVKAKISRKFIAVEFNISLTSISRIVNKKLYKDC